jgi:serine/threonine protein kinase
MWKRLTHPNILPLLGVTIDHFQLISNWMSGGDLSNYIKKHSGADRIGLVGVLPIAFIPLIPPYSCHQLSDVAEGLCYLHSCDIVHGDLKGVCGYSKSRSPPVNAHPVKCPRGRLRSCAHRGFRSRYGHPKPGSRPESVASAWLHHAMGCAGGLE